MVLWQQEYAVSLGLRATGSSTGRRQRQRIIPTNDELLYDPDEDDRDQAWVDARRRQWVERSCFQVTRETFSVTQPLVFLFRYSSRTRVVGVSQSKHRHAQVLPSSDAILNCPACMTTLCLDCQRWEIVDIGRSFTRWPVTQRRRLWGVKVKSWFGNIFLIFFVSRWKLNNMAKAEWEELIVEQYLTATCWIVCLTFCSNTCWHCMEDD